MKTMNQAKEVLLGVNIDHVATLRQARGTRYPEPIQAALVAEQGGADGITLHLREDRRHVQDRDVEMLSDILQTRMNLEMAAARLLFGAGAARGVDHRGRVGRARKSVLSQGFLRWLGRSRGARVPVHRR